MSQQDAGPSQNAAGALKMVVYLCGTINLTNSFVLL